MADHALSVGIVGGGIVGLSLAWYLQEEGAQVTVLERRAIGAGASWGNAGALAPALAVPLPERAAIVAAAKGMFAKESAIVLPRRVNAALVRFLASFARNATDQRWYASMRSYVPLSEQAIAAYRYMTENGVAAHIGEARFVIACHDAHEGVDLLAELSRVVDAGLPLDIELLTCEQLHEAAPLTAPHHKFGIRMNGQHFVDPPALLDAIAASVRSRGGTIIEDSPVREVRRRSRHLVCTSERFSEHAFDAVVLATGSWLPALAREHGVRVAMYPGRGYSVCVPLPEPAPGMMYFPAPRLACTPYRGALRVSSVMEFAGADRAPTRRLAQAFQRRAERSIPRALWDQASEVWVGGRPLTADGKPLLGRSKTEGVYVAGGHAMWGVTHGAVTGRLMAALIAQGSSHAALAPFDPLRGAS